jgi:hypothetical protein
MYKLRKIYICNHCGKIALPELKYCGMDAVKTMPSGWGIVSKNEHLCDECYKAYAKMRLGVKRDD